MKILFISSGYNGTYEWFESCIQTELRKENDVSYFQLEKGISELQSLTKLFMPDVVLTLVGFYLPEEMLQWYKQQGIKTVVWLTEDPYYMDLTSPLVNHYDYLFTIDIAALEYYENNGHQKAYHMPLATDPKCFQPKQVDEKYQSDICLLGYPYRDRIGFIQLLLQHTSYKIKVVGPWSHVLRRFRRYPNIDIHDEWVEPAIAANYYNGTKIVLNTHRPANERHNQNKLGIIGKSINNRTFDVAACAAFQLIDFKEDLPFQFIENEEIVSFKDVQEAIHKINYYIHADEERIKIGNNGRKRVLKEHIFEHRINKMISIIQNSTI